MYVAWPLNKLVNSNKEIKGCKKNYEIEAKMEN